MAVKQLLEFLDEHDIRYMTITHSLAYTAQEVAAAAHVSGNEIAKTVIVKIDGDLVMAVIPANRKVDLAAIQKITGADKVELASEQEFRNKFKECELGAMPPFGNLYHMDVIAEEDLAYEQSISFNAGSHLELVKMKYDDFAQWVKPKVAHITRS